MENLLLSLPDEVRLILKKAQQVRERERELNCLTYTLPNSGNIVNERAVESWIAGMKTFLDDSGDLLKAGVSDTIARPIEDR